MKILTEAVRQLSRYVVAQIRYGEVEAVVYDRFVPCLLGPRLEGTGERAADFLQGEVEDHGRPACRRCLCARGPVVSRDGAPKGHVHVGVGI
jgi:hypothetical protein